MRNVFVKIAVAGNILRDPLTKAALKPTGEWKPANSFWLRRIADGDVVDATKEQTAAQAAAKVSAAAAPAERKSIVEPEAPAKGPRNATPTSNAS